MAVRSMSGESMGQAQAGLRRCLDLLRPEDRFTIVRFASNHSAFSPVLRQALPDTMSKRAGRLRCLRVVLGGIPAGGDEAPAGHAVGGLEDQLTLRW